MTTASALGVRLVGSALRIAGVLATVRDAIDDLDLQAAGRSREPLARAEARLAQQPRPGVVEHLGSTLARIAGENA